MTRVADCDHHHCSDCECEHEASVLGGMVVLPPERGTQLQSLWEAESARVEDEDYNDSSIGGDEPFREHGNLLWSEDCDECDEAMWRLSDEITNAIRNGDTDA